MSAATDAVSVFYRRTLIDLDKDRTQLRAGGACAEVIAALDHYRGTLKAALQTPGVTR